MFASSEPMHCGDRLEAHAWREIQASCQLFISAAAVSLPLAIAALMV